MPEMLVRCLPGCHLAMLSAQTHKPLDIPAGLLGASALALPPDPSHAPALAILRKSARKW
jgi:hypothetical protein